MPSGHRQEAAAGDRGPGGGRDAHAAPGARGRRRELRQGRLQARREVPRTLLQVSEGQTEPLPAAEKLSDLHGYSYDQRLENVYIDFNVRHTPIVGLGQ